MTSIPDLITEKDGTAVLAINVGQPKPLPGQKREVLSGIVKHPVSVPVFLSFTGMMRRSRSASPGSRASS